MATYAFETITAAQALAITAEDTLTFASGPSNQVAVLYDPTSTTITLVAGARAVAFGSALASVSMSGRLQTADGSRLWIGGPDAETTLAPTAAAADGLYGGAGNDRLDGGDGNDLLQGNAGTDDLSGQGGDDVIYGGQDYDRIGTGEGVNFAQGNKGDDVIYGGSGSDTLLGGQGNDYLDSSFSGQVGAGASDVLNGNLGDDLIRGAGVLLGEGGNDTLTGRDGVSTLLGGDGADSISAPAGYIEGGGGADVVVLGTGLGGQSTVRGGEGDDAVKSGFGQTWSLVFYGEDGNDSLLASSGVDTLSGGEGADTISGFGGSAGGFDQLSGGAGADLFIVWNGAINGETGAALDAARIVDWEAVDRIDARSPDLGAATSANYREITAGSVDAAYAVAQDLRTGQGVNWVAAQVGDDVVVMGTSFTFQRAMVLLVGRTLADISFENFA